MDEKDIDKTINVFLDKDGILNAVFHELITVPELNALQGQTVVNRLIGLAKQHPGAKFNVLIDLTALGNSTYVSSQTRKSYAQAMQYEQMNKLAIVGTSVAFRVTLNFIVAVAGRSDVVRWFNDKQKALEWLKENK